jgi:uncharacterized membrane protein YcaP (DUF421 family)
MSDWVELLIGPGQDPKQLTLVQISVRCFLIFTASLVMVRLGAKRFLARKTAFDIIMAFILGSMLARAINGSAPLLGTIVGGFVLIGVHRLFAWAAFHSHAFGSLIKGNEDVVIEAGKIQPAAMRKNHFTERDLLEDLRLQSHASVEEVESARIERSGELSIIPKKPSN